MISAPEDTATETASRKKRGWENEQSLSDGETTTRSPTFMYLESKAKKGKQKKCEIMARITQFMKTTIRGPGS